MLVVLCTKSQCSPSFFSSLFSRLWAQRASQSTKRWTSPGSKKSRRISTSPREKPAARPRRALGRMAVVLVKKGLKGLWFNSPDKQSHQPTCFIRSQSLIQDCPIPLQKPGNLTTHTLQRSEQKSTFPTWPDLGANQTYRTGSHSENLLVRSSNAASWPKQAETAKVQCPSGCIKGLSKSSDWLPKSAIFQEALNWSLPKLMTKSRKPHGCASPWYFLTGAEFFLQK